MTIKLQNLTLENFKGVKHLEIDAGGENLSVYGNNGTGKTTIADAFLWLLFGKDSAGRSDFEIKTLDKDGKPINFIDHSVRATITADGINIELEKIYREKWVRSRGSVDREFHGHETEYIIDGIPKSKTEYTAFIKDIVDEEIFRLLTNPMYFNNDIDNNKRRTMLFDTFGDISDAEVIAANSPVLGDLADLIGTHSLNEIKTATAQKKRRINADLQAIPNRIDEANRFIKDNVKKSPDELEIEIKSCSFLLTEKEEALRDLNTDTVADEYRRKAREEIRELEATAREERDKAHDDWLSAAGAVERAEKDMAIVNRKIKDLSSDFDIYEARVHGANKTLEQFRKEWQTAFDSKYESDNKCPTCGQHLPTEQIAAAVAKFNANKAQTLEGINDEAEHTKKRIAEYESAIERNKAERKRLEAAREEIEKIKRGFETAADDAAENLANVRAKHKAIISEKKNALAEWEFSRTSDGIDKAVRESLESQIAAIRANIRALEIDYSTLKNNEMFKARISELESEARRLSGEYEKLERTEYLIGEFTKLKASMIEEKINSNFKFAKFKLFESQINGGIVETCEVTYNGVPYSVLNSAMKLNIGIDIINAFSNHYGVAGVIFLDNAESVTEIFPSTSQFVKLYVSAADDALRVEKDI